MGYQHNNIFHSVFLFYKFNATLSSSKCNRTDGYCEKRIKLFILITGVMGMLDKEKVGKTIAAYRKEHEMTQKELADRLHISYQAVSKWEVGAGIPTVEMLCELAAIFHVSVDALLNDDQWDNRRISYRDAAGLDTRNLYMLKEELMQLNTKDKHLISSDYADAVLFQIDMSAYKNPVFSMITCVPGSKEQLAIMHGYDKEICMDTAVSGINFLVQHGMKPVTLQGRVLCTGERHDRLRQMAQGFRDICAENDILFAGMEIAAQPLNYSQDEFHISAGLFGVAEKEEIPCPEHIQSGDVVIGIQTTGIDGTNYPFIKVMADRNKNLFHERLANGNLFLDEIMSENTAYMHEILYLQKEKLLHGICRVSNSIVRQKMCKFLPETLGICIDLSAIPITDLYRLLYRQDMIGKKVFHYHFNLGIGMLVIVSKENKERAMEIISQYHPCYCIGRVEKRRNKDTQERIWTKGEIQW